MADHENGDLDDESTELDLFGDPVLRRAESPRPSRDERPQRIRVLVLVKAYPALSTKHGEVVCVAGVRLDGPPRWIRLFPVDYRGLAVTDKFKKYQVIDVDVFRPASDRRPESWSPRLDSLELGSVLPSAHGWSSRKAVIRPLEVESMCWLQRRQQEDATSLGVFRPRVVEDFEVLAARDQGSIREGIKQAIRDQRPLFGPDRMPLEPSPYEFRFRYRCADPGCRGHSQTFIDWEAVQAARNWRHDYDEPTLRAKLRQKFLDEACGPTRDVSFFVGNMHQNPVSFLVLGLFWPPAVKSEAVPLF